MDAADLSYLWEGKTAWKVEQWHETIRRVWVRFKYHDGPRVTEILKMRLLLPRLENRPPIEVRRELGKSEFYILGDFGNMEGHRLLIYGRELGLDMDETVTHRIYLVVRHPDDGTGGIIDDEEEMRYVLQKMHEMGRPVGIVECD